MPESPHKPLGSVKGPIGYNIQLLMHGPDAENKRDQDISQYVTRLRIVHAANTCWPQIIITIIKDASDLILRNFYGQYQLELSIERTGIDNNVIERVSIDLLYLQSNIDLTPKEQEVGDQGNYPPDFSPVTISCIPKYPYLFMSTFANDVFEDDSAPYESIDLLKKAIENIGFKDNLHFDRRGISGRTIKEIVIPPMAIKNMIEYINQEYYFYNGPFFYFCDIDGNLFTWDLNQKMIDTPIAYIHQPPNKFIGSKVMTEILEGDATNVANYYTKDPIQTLYYGNANILKTGYNSIAITHPSDELYRNFSTNIDDVSSLYGVSDPEGATGVKYSEFLNARKKYSYMYSGDDTKALVTSNVSDKIKSISGLRLVLRGNVPLVRFFRIGEPISFSPHSFKYQPYRGKYIFWSSDFIITKQDTNWETECKITMYRTSQSFDTNQR